MSNRISHSGIVECVADGHVKVRILQTSACAACKAASHCNASEAKEKIIDVNCTSNAAYQPGQQVVVTASRDVANRALLLGFGIPVLILVGTVVAATWLSYDEGTAALASIAMLAPYFLMLWLLRDRIGRSISFEIEELKN